MNNVVPRQYLNKYGGVYTTRINNGSFQNFKKVVAETKGDKGSIKSKIQERPKPNPARSSAKSQQTLYNQIFAPDTLRPGRGIVPM